MSCIVFFHDILEQEKLAMMDEIKEKIVIEFTGGPKATRNLPGRRRKEGANYRVGDTKCKIHGPKRRRTPNKSGFPITNFYDTQGGSRKRNKIVLVNLFSVNSFVLRLTSKLGVTWADIIAQKQIDNDDYG